MKFLFCGLGSIGQRHLRNLKKLRPDAEIYALRRTSNSLVIEDGKAKNAGSLDDYYGITSLSSISEVKKIKPDVSFVTNPSSMHAETAASLAELGSHLFIEKPVSCSTKGLSALRDTIRKKKLLSFVGYQSRFNPVVMKAKEITEKNRKNLISASFEWNTYLPSHHPYEDYSKGYAARDSLGGGSILCLIHEIDLIYHFFGIPAGIMAAGGKLSNLSMTADDTAMAILKYSAGNRLMPVSLNLSLAQTKETRSFRLQFNDATLITDLTSNRLELYDAEGALAEKFTGYRERNRLFIDELSYFLDCVENGGSAVPDVEEGIKSLEIALDIRKRMGSDKG
jgi:predicted dehydrogenase